jgi:hypothetical protein
MFIMSRLLLALLALFLGGIFLSSAPAQTDNAVADPNFTARTRALDLAGAFANDGYKLRDGYWAVAAGEPVPALEVFLFAGNFYWFTAATSEAADAPGALRVQLFNAAGELVEAQTYEDQGLFALGVSPGETGAYFLRVLPPAATAFALVYSYK